MARPPITDEELIARYGPHLNEAPPGGWNAGLADRQGREHALLLLRSAVRHQAQGARQHGGRVRTVVRVPVQRRQALPEGCEALPAGRASRSAAAPDGTRRHRTRRVPATSPGIRRSTVSSSEIRRIQAEHGDDAFAMLSGVSLTNEKSYLVGKFARLALHTANLDYNGRYCMVSAGTGNKKALGVDRAPNPWSDIPLADVVWVAGSNVAETFPITTSYIWRARDRGAKLIVQDPRVVPLARTADLFLPVRPGTDSALFGAVLHVLIERDWLDHDFIDAHTLQLRRSSCSRRRHDTGVGGRHHRRAGGPHRGGGRAVGHLGDRDDAARPRDRAAHQGRRQRARRDQPRARHRQVRQTGLRCVDDHRAGQRPRRTRARPQVRPAARQPRHHQPRAPCRGGEGVELRRSPTSPARACRRRS